MLSFWLFVIISNYFVWLWVISATAKLGYLQLTLLNSQLLEGSQTQSIQDIPRPKSSTEIPSSEIYDATTSAISSHLFLIY